MSASAQLFNIEGNEIFEINTLDDLDQTYLGFRAAEKDTEYTLTFTHTNIGLSYKQLNLIDLVENKTIDISSSGSKYEFTANNVKDIQKRFKIEGIPAGGTTTGNDNEANMENIIIYTNQKDIIINHKDIQSGSIYLYDISGRCIIEKNLEQSGKTIIHADFAPNGVYIIKLITNNNKIDQSIIL